MDQSKSKQQTSQVAKLSKLFSKALKSKSEWSDKVNLDRVKLNNYKS